MRQSEGAHGQVIGQAGQTMQREDKALRRLYRVRKILENGEAPTPERLTELRQLWALVVKACRVIYPEVTATSSSEDKKLQPRGHIYILGLNMAIYRSLHC